MGLGQSSFGGHPEFWGGLIDLDPAVDPTKSIALLCAHFGTVSREDQVALQMGVVLFLACSGKQRPFSPLPQLRADGAYLITGGLGDLGLELASWMVRSGARRLILLAARLFRPGPSGIGHLCPRPIFEESSDSRVGG